MADRPDEDLAYDMYTPPPQWVIHMFSFVLVYVERGLTKIKDLADTEPRLASWELSKSMDMGRDCYVDALRYISTLELMLRMKFKPNKLTLEDDSDCILEWASVSSNGKPCALDMHVRVGMWVRNTLSLYIRATKLKKRRVLPQIV